MSPAALYRLMSWLTPGFPVGAYSHSSGLEWAVEQNLVTSGAALAGWIRQVVTAGAMRSDAVLFTYSYRAAAEHNEMRLLEIAELAAALHPGRERRFESLSQGAAFRRIARAAAPCAALHMLDSIEDNAVCYPVAVGVVASGHGIALPFALTAFLHAAASNLVSAGQRLIPIGQTDAQIVINELERSICATAEWASQVTDPDPLDVIHSSTLMADFASLAHETQHTRLFRT
jgi:urease accessory protein